MAKKSVDELLHDADRKVCGAQFARRMQDIQVADEMEREAARLYHDAEKTDPEFADIAWREDGNRDYAWLRSKGFKCIAALDSAVRP